VFWLISLFIDSASGFYWVTYVVYDCGSQSHSGLLEPRTKEPLQHNGYKHYFLKRNTHYCYSIKVLSLPVAYGFLENSLKLKSSVCTRLQYLSRQQQRWQL
jgi:hypothetical protein